MDIIISRSEWTGSEESRAATVSSSLTPNDRGERCCLGHLMLAIDPLFIMFNDRNIQMPIDVPNYHNVPEWLLSWDTKWNEENDENEDYRGNSRISSALAHYNDNYSGPQEEKEALIAYTLGEYGFDVTFVD